MASAQSVTLCEQNMSQRQLDTKHMKCKIFSVFKLKKVRKKCGICLIFLLKQKQTRMEKVGERAGKRTCVRDYRLSLESRCQTATRWMHVRGADRSWLRSWLIGSDEILLAQESTRHMRRSCMSAMSHWFCLMPTKGLLLYLDETYIPHNSLFSFKLQTV